MAWDGKERAADYTYHCTKCFGLGTAVDGSLVACRAITSYCVACANTGRDPIPWAELFRERRPW